MASCFTILDSKGAPIIYRTYRGDISQDIFQTFQKKVVDQEDILVKPVFEVQGVTYTFIKENDVYLLMVSCINTVSLGQIAYMKQCVNVFEYYFKRVTEETVRDNFVIIYELLDEMCDFGYPQYTEEKILKEYITQEGLVSKYILNNDTLQAQQLPSAVTGAGGSTPWRAPGKYHYRKNEVFVDVVEMVNLLATADGNTLSSEVVGVVNMNVKLSGMPLLKLGVNDKLLFNLLGRSGKSVDMDDLKFHQCVKMNTFENERIISFIPPDGKFELLRYRLNKTIKPPIQLTVRVVRHGTSRVQIFITGQTTFRRNSIASFIDIIVPIPSDADKPAARCSMGAVRYAPESNVLLWGLRNISGGKEFNFRGQYHLPSVRSKDMNVFAKAPVQVKYEIPYMAVSGFQVRYVKVTEKSNYEATPWVRYVTESGDYQFRTN
ncbi:AP-1 complex subunit mu [Angomonas deanei]|uniref:Adaptor complexes medium subunit family, putative n=1 Tax=Angomonas deanei TaxID=59799 RepID=S9V6M5_9TRYP|nr:AP-1 complex subunit mu [Angomonas deanei]EPY43216.1 AP-1 complex subunit mu [Angomonas deanei]CAD2218438.1 Adaptor complexes medium subunit family, putative [Angomonas deanei]|eukprot:EPY36724.1 AP-1 complex subunit mu [Angomonas deanei]